MMRAFDYDAYDQPHHPRCPANPDNPDYEEEYVDVDRVRMPACRCDELDADAYDREMESRVDRERDRWVDEGGEG